MQGLRAGALEMAQLLNVVQVGGRWRDSAFWVAMLVLAAPLLTDTATMPDD